MNEQDFRELLNHKPYLNHDCLEKGTRHIQLSGSVVNPSGRPYYYLDAVFMGNDGKVYFFVSDRKGCITEKEIQEVRACDLTEMFSRIKNNKIIK